MIRFFRSITVLLILALLLSLPAILQAAEAIGLLAVEAGAVKLTRSSTERLVRKGDGVVSVETGDWLQSGKDGRGKMIMAKGDQQVDLYPGSILMVDEVSSKGSFLNLRLGKALFAVLRKTAQQEFQVKTPTVVVGVKGTEFVVGTDGVTKSFLLTVTGVVSMSMPEFAGREVLVTADRAAFATAGTPPSPPIPVAPETRTEIIKEPGLRTLEKIEAENRPATSGGGQKQQGGGAGQQSEESKESSGESTSEQSGGGSLTTPASTAAMMEVITTVQQTQQTIQKVTESVQSNCPNSGGCGQVKLSW